MPKVYDPKTRLYKRAGMSAIRYVGANTKISLRWDPERTDGHGKSWVVGMYHCAFNVGGKKLDGPTLHVFNVHAPGGSRTPEDLGLDAEHMSTPHAYDVAAHWAMENLLEGSRIAPHWSYGRAKTAAQALWRDVEEHGSEVRRKK